jgi:UDP-N-acetylglucosamine 2-epimerase (non-hydrolysing)
MHSIIHLIAGARPNFMKIAPLYHAMKHEHWCDAVLVHTGQHYDADMSGTFFHDLGLPNPDIHLGVGSGTHAKQTAGVMIAYEQICLKRPPIWTIVVGDVNSTLACALTAKKLHISVAHLEAGLRSGDRTMPEEINRIVTDSIADILWIPSKDAEENLLHEGIAGEKISFVGNIMIDSFEMLRDEIEEAQTRKKFGHKKKGYGALTLHRPSNVDDASTLNQLVDTICAVAADFPLVFPVHPRTKKRLQQIGLLDRLQAAPGLSLTSPMGYVEFMGLVIDAKFVITDSGGIQEETTYLNIPCLTLRDTTERPATISMGTNRLVGALDLDEQVNAAISGTWVSGTRPELWDGKTAERVVEDLKSRIG